MSVGGWSGGGPTSTPALGDVAGAVGVGEPVVVVVVVVVVVGGAFAGGTRNVSLKSRAIVSGGSSRSTSWIRFARTVTEQTVPAPGACFGLST